MYVKSGASTISLESLNQCRYNKLPTKAYLRTWLRHLLLIMLLNVHTTLIIGKTVVFRGFSDTNVLASTGSELSTNLATNLTILLLFPRQKLKTKPELIIGIFIRFRLGVVLIQLQRQVCLTKESKRNTEKEWKTDHFDKLFTPAEPFHEDQLPRVGSLVVRVIVLHQVLFSLKWFLG